MLPKLKPINRRPSHPILKPIIRLSAVGKSWLSVVSENQDLIHSRKRLPQFLLPKKEEDDQLTIKSMTPKLKPINHRSSHPKPKQSNPPSSYIDSRWLPPDLMDLIVHMIVHKLFELDDVIRLSAVCKSWRSVILENRGLIHSRQRLPLLLLLKKEEDDQLTIKSLYNPISKKFHKFQGTCPSNNMVNCLPGWLATFTETKTSTTVTLFSPFTDTVISLPPILTSFHIKKILLSTDPYLAPNDYLVIVSNSSRGLMMIKPGTSHNWIHISWKSVTPSFFFGDIIYDNKTKMINAIDDAGQLISIMNLDSEVPESKLITSKIYKKRATYLVESSEGDLVMVRRFYSSGIKTNKFEVFKLSSSTSPEWVRTRNLGGDALFISHGHCIAVWATGLYGCRSNCIYYTDYFYPTGSSNPFETSNPFERELYISIFQLEYGTICPCVQKPGYFASHFVWIMPMMKGI